MISDLGPQRLVARVRHVDWEERVAYLELRSGTAIVHELTEGVEEHDQDAFTLGDILLIGPDWKDVEFGAPEQWPDETHLAIVRKILNDQVIVEAGLRLQALKLPPGVEVNEGATVEVSDVRGIRRVVTREPIGLSTLADRSSIDVDIFKQTPDDSISLNDFGGNPEIKERARELIELRLSNSEKFARIKARPIKGVLFSGPSGTGKTMLARIIASRAKATFYLVSGPQIFSKWYGQSEELIRAIFADAEKQERAVIVFDEIDSVANQRSEDSHEASKRIVGQLLTTMDGFTARNNIVVVATTNRPDDLDVALRRPGRFDWEIRFGYPTRHDRIAILKQSGAKLNIGEGLPHDRIASLTDGWSSAHLVAIWSEAAILAIKDGRDIILPEDYVGGYERVAVLHELMATAAAKMTPEKL